MEATITSAFNNPFEFCASLLQTSVKCNDRLAGKLVHARIIKAGLHAGVYLMNNLISFYVKVESIRDARHVFDEMLVKSNFTWNTLVSAYARRGKLDSARRLFEEMPDPDSVSWTAMISGYSKLGYFEYSIKLFKEMILSGIAPTMFTITSVLSSCSTFKALDTGKKVHSFVVKYGLSCYISVSNSLLNMYAKTGDSTTAKLVFSQMALKNTSSWNVIISSQMQCGQIDLAQALFDGMSDRDVVSWNSMISGYNQLGRDLEALEIFSKMMKQSSLKPDCFSLTSALSACANLEKSRLGKQVQSYIIRADFESSEEVKNALVSMYSKSGEVQIAQKVLDHTPGSDISVMALTALFDGYIKAGDIIPARQIFDSLNNPDVVAWTAMIVGYVQNGFVSEAMDLFRFMVGAGPKPNSYTLAAMLSVSSSLASLNHSREIHGAAIRSGEALSVSVGNGLINAYAKAGSITGARLVFNLMCFHRDTISWTSMIIALAQHGLGQEAIVLFEEMLTLNITPDQITYVGVLSACTHVGLVEQGRDFFSLMQNVHKIKPTHSLYACMVDLYGRNGLLQEALDFIQSMPIEPDDITWGSLLASCRVHKNIDLARVAAERLLRIDPESSGAYLALANVYSACGRWDDVATVWKTMKDRGVKKKQGSSWIQMGNKVHVFGVEDGLHPQKDAIYGEMAKIWKEIKKMGFIPDTKAVLHDLDEELKELVLSHHSEKLAVAFGLINTPEKSTLRIMKNLRICNDCHTAIKFISKLVDREIIVRDATRFHHFKGGSCSCWDYW